jgi:hypothetical protein
MYDSSQPMTVYDSPYSLLDCECLLIHCDEWRTKNSCPHIELPWKTSVCLSVWRTSVKNLLDWTSFQADGESVTRPYSSSVVLFFIRCRETFVSLMATLWFIQAYSLLRNVLLASRCLAMDYSVTIWYSTCYIAICPLTINYHTLKTCRVVEK